MMNFANVKEWRIPINGTMTEVFKVTCVIDGQNKIIWQKDTGPDYTEPFYVENITNSTETLSIIKSHSLAPTLTLEYKIDNSNWTPFENPTSTTALTLPLSPGEKIYLRCSANSWGNSNYYTTINGISKVGGNIMSLLYGSDFVNQFVFPADSICTFRNLFDTNTNLLFADKLILPATTLVTSCYSHMFYGCTSLTTTPVLPATTLARDCYWGMFENCTSLTKAPDLLATTTALDCYSSMFRGCSSLNTIKCMSSYGGNDRTDYWVQGVSSTGTFVKAAGSTWVTGIHGIPEGWTVVEV